MEQVARFNKQIMKLIKRDWPVFLMMVLLFFAGVWLGGRAPQMNQALAGILEKQALQKFESMAKWLTNMPFFVWILVIWFNNLLASTVSFFSGILLIPPALMVLANGAIVGLVQKISVTHGIDGFHFYLGIMPHGIFELTAFFIAAGLGIRFGLVFYRSWWRILTGRGNNGLVKSFAAEMKYYLILIVILFSIAAIIEVTVSPLLLH